MTLDEFITTLTDLEIVVELHRARQLDDQATVRLLLAELKRRVPVNGGTSDGHDRAIESSVVACNPHGASVGGRRTP